MKHLAIFFILLLTAVFTLFPACDKKPSEPEYSNPFDMENKDTRGDPFQLNAQIANGGVTLTWSKPAIEGLQSFKIYRSEQENSGYTQVGTATASQTQFVDQTVTNGHSYWYRVTAINQNNKETLMTNQAAVNIKTEPFLVINGGAQYTASRTVSLTILANTARQMIIANKADFSDGQWENYATSKTWLLPAGAGQKTVYLKVKYDGDIESDIVYEKIIFDITPPIIALTVTPDSGITNETEFQFDPTASSDNLTPDDELQVRFDWENDGSWDSGWIPSAIITHQYTIGGGNKTAKMELRDGAGWTAETTASVFVNTRPVAQFTATEDDDNSLLYHFDASASSDYEDGTNLEYRWDYDGNGVWDTPFSPSAAADHEYPDYRTYNARLAVRDRNGLESLVEEQINVQRFVEMVFVEGGTFTMGDTWGDGSSDEQPTHQVTLNSFYISKYEVTQAQYREVMGTNPSNFTGDNLPVEKVSWYNAVTFCNALSQREGLTPCYVIDGTNTTCNFNANGYRLPTEAEWEYAARGGAQATNTKYSGSNTPGDVAWYYDNSGSQTHDVGTKQANELGIYDMSGNVWEWCWDWYGSYSSSAQTNPIGPASGSSRVFRGGSWNNITGNIRVANRGSFNPTGTRSYYGFRISRRF